MNIRCKKRTVFSSPWFFFIFLIVIFLIYPDPPPPSSKPASERNCNWNKMFASHSLWTFTIKWIQINFVFSKHKRNKEEEKYSFGFSVFILLYFSRNFLKWFYRHFIIFYFSFHLLKSRKKKNIFQFVVYKYFPLFQKVVIYFLIFLLAFLIAKYFCCQKHSITERNFFRSYHFSRRLWMIFND